MGRRPLSALAAVAAVCAAAGIVLPRWLPAQVPPAAGWILLGTALALIALGLIYRGRTDGCAEASPGLRRRYAREQMAAMGAYVALLLLSVWLLRRIDEPALRAAVALLPVPPIALAVRAMIRYVRGVDEMQQRIELEAVGIATIVVSMLYMTGGFLQSARVIQLPGDTTMILVFPLVCFSYGVAKAFVSRRYR